MSALHSRSFKGEAEPPLALVWSPYGMAAMIEAKQYHPRTFNVSGLWHSIDTRKYAASALVGGTEKSHRKSMIVL